MSVLTTATRKNLPASAFALPKKRKFPIEDKPHARDALSRVSESLHKGNISSGEAATVRAKARKFLGK